MAIYPDSFNGTEPAINEFQRWNIGAMFPSLHNGTLEPCNLTEELNQVWKICIHIDGVFETVAL